MERKRNLQQKLEIPFFAVVRLAVHVSNGVKS
jgi:hypothetical protein